MNKKRFWDIFRIGTDTPKNRLEYLDFLRGAAMLLVLLHLFLKKEIFHLPEALTLRTELE